jgi:hypothetical protein
MRGFFCALPSLILNEKQSFKCLSIATKNGYVHYCRIGFRRQNMAHQQGERKGCAAPAPRWLMDYKIQLFAF